MSTVDDDLDLFDQLKKDAETFREEHHKEGYDGLPVFFLDDGNYWLRIYPEILEKDGKKRLSIMRLIHTHSGMGTRRLPCEGPSCRICKEVKKMEDAGVQNTWKWGMKEEAMVKLCIYKTSAKSEYVKENVPAIAVLRYRGILALQNFIADLEPGDLKDVLNVNAAAPMLKLTQVSGSSGGTSIGFDIKKAMLPPIEEGMPLLKDTYVKDDNYATDEEFKKVRQFVNETIAKSTNVFVPKEEGGSGEDDDIPFNSSASMDAKAEAPKESSASANECPSNDPALSFGNHPESQNFDCIICNQEAACLAATKAAKK